MDIIKDALDALSPLSARGIPVKQGWYDESKKDLHITLWLISLRPEADSDDDPEAESGIVQVNIWSGRDQVSLKKEIKRSMRAHGFKFIDAHDEAETDSRIFINAMRFIKISEYESEE